MRTKEELTTAVSGAHSMAEVVRRLGLNKSSSTYNVVRREIKYYSIETNFKQRARNTKKYTPEEIFAENSSYDRGTLRTKLIKENSVNYECQCCVIKDWNGPALSLQLDHINGNRKDNRIQNLRFLCPNCHSQTKTWGNKIR
jgi:hypothetical protein